MFKPIIALMSLLSLTACGQRDISDLTYEQRQVRYQQIAAAYEGTPVRVNYAPAPVRSSPRVPAYAASNNDPIVVNDSPYEFVDNLGEYRSSNTQETIYEDQSVSVVKETGPSPADFYYRRAP